LACFLCDIFKGNDGALAEPIYQNRHE